MGHLCELKAPVDLHLSMLSAVLRRSLLAGRRQVATAVAEVPTAPEVSELVDRLCQLNLLQTSQVVCMLKERLNLPDIVAAAAPAAASPGAGAAPAAAAAPVEAKTEFRVTLEKYEAASKAKVIREVKALLTTLNLVEAKAFVEGAPKLIKEKVKKEEAEKIKAALEAAGATVTLD